MVVFGVFSQVRKNAELINLYQHRLEINDIKLVLVSKASSLTVAKFLRLVLSHNHSTK